MAGVWLAGVLLISTGGAKSARWTLAVECAGLQRLARCPAMAGAGQAGVWPTLAHAGTPQSAAQLQPLVVHVQQADAALQADPDGGPLLHHGSLVIWDASHKQVCIQVEAVGAAGALA